MGVEDLGRSVLHLATDPTQLRAGLAAAREESLSTLVSTQKQLQSIGSQISATGSKMTVGLTGPVVGLGAAVVGVGATFEHTLSEIVGLVGVGREQVNAWKPEIEDIAAATGVGPESLAKALYFVASSGLDASKAMDVLRMSAKAAEAGMGDVTTIAGVLTSSLNAYTRQGLQAADATDILVRGIQVGAAEPEDFANAIGMVAPAAAQLNVTYKDLIGTTAILSRVNKNVAEDATSLSQIFNTLLKPTNQTNEALAAMGLSADQLRKVLSEQGLMAMLRLLASHIGDDDEAIAKIFPNIRALRGVLNLTGQDAKTVDEAMAKVADSTGALDDAVNAVANDASTKMAQATARMQDDLIGLSDDVLPTAVDLLDKLADAVHGAVRWFQELPPDVKATVVQGVALLAIIGPILVILGSLVGAIGGLLGAGASLAGFLSGTLIPRLYGLGVAVLSVGIESLATAIFATGIPALERLAVALVGVEAAAGPIVIALTLIATAAAIGDQNFKGLAQHLAEIGASKDEIDAIARAMGRSTDELEAAVDAAQKKIQADKDAAAAAEYQAVQQSLANYQTFRAGELADQAAEHQLVAQKAWRDTGQAAKDAAAALHQAADKAVADVVKFASDTLTAVRNFRTSLEDAFKVAKDAESERAETQIKIQLQLAALASAEADYTKHHKGWTAEQLGQWKLQQIEGEKSLSELRLHLLLIGTQMEQEQAAQALLTSKDMLAGLSSKFPEIQAAYENLRDESLNHLWELAQGTGPAARAAANDLKKYLDPSNPLSPLHNASSWGGHTAEEWLSFLTGKINAAADPGGEVYDAVHHIGDVLRALSPPGPKSPLHDIGKWGFRTALEYIGNFAAGLHIGPIDQRLSVLASRLRSGSFGMPGLAPALAGAAGGGAFPILPSAASDVARAAVGRHGPLIGNLNVDARGHANPAAVGDAVKQAVSDAMADVLRDESLRGFQEALP